MKTETTELKNIELEVKFRIGLEKQFEFKNLVSESGDFTFLYVESDDIYYVNDDGDFLRYRFSDDKKEKRAELTFKKKLNEHNNNKRIEVNLRVDPNTPELVGDFAEGLGYKRNFRINKSCHIYKKSDVTVVFYTVQCENGTIDHFIEIEVAENAGFTEDEGWGIIREWERKLEPLGIKPQNRLRKSLYEMYRR